MITVNLPAESGTYVLVFTPEERISLHYRGPAELPAGTLLYTGSAFGPGGLRARIARHLRREKKIHWHVDALTAATPITAIMFDATGVRLECAWAERIRSLPGITHPLPGFGASDCRCPSHLFACEMGGIDRVHAALGRPGMLLIEGV